MAVLEPKMQSGFLNVAMHTLALPVLLPSDLPVTGTLLTLAPFLLLYTVYRFVYYVRSTVLGAEIQILQPIGRCLKWLNQLNSWPGLL